jgi:(S)-3,5-dihydroxyphenylglycine transaminase
MDKGVMQSYSQSEVMNFLNEISGRFPSAISLAAGRPTDRLFAQLGSSAIAESFLTYEHYASHKGDQVPARVSILQYGKTAGMINELVAEQLHVDHGVSSPASQIIVTAGCQEALAICLPVLCPETTDVLLVCNPTYIGVTGAAQTSGVRLRALPSVSDQTVSDDLEKTILQALSEGLTPRALYLIPDFDNPTGRVLSKQERHAILAVCARHRVVVLEDSAYGLFRYRGDPTKTMFALDEAGSVIYLSTFSKTLSPALRVGSITLPERLFGDKNASQALFAHLVQRKSFVTVNTSQVAQAIVGGLLIEQNCSLLKWIKPAIEEYSSNRIAMLQQLSAVFSPMPWDITWSDPSGGFFLSLDLPFEVDGTVANECASKFGVIVMPMAFFALDSSQNKRVRLAFSSASHEQISKGVEALGNYVAREIQRPMI